MLEKSCTFAGHFSKPSVKATTPTKYGKQRKYHLPDGGGELMEISTGKDYNPRNGWRNPFKSDDHIMF